MFAVRRNTSVILAAAITAFALVDSISPCVAASHKKRPAQEKSEPAISKPAAVDPSSAPDTVAPAAASATPKPTDPAPEAAKPAADPKAKSETAATPPETWSETEIAEAKAACAEVFKRVDAVVIAREPIREGACGAPAPVEVLSIGHSPEVALSPPAIIRCDLVEALATWLEKDVQPLARKHLKSEIVKIETMSSYACRNAYRRKTTRLSEHGLANALDIGDFVTASAKTASVLDSWGETEREQIARLAAEKAAAAERAAAEVAAAEKTANANLVSANAAAAPPAATLAASATGLVRATIAEGIPPQNLDPNEKLRASNSRKLASTRPEKLGGPDILPNDAGPRRSRKKGPLAFTPRKTNASRNPEMQAFLKAAHRSACRIFGTTLGPEANADHLNHFHVDMAARKFKKICD